MSGGEKMSHKIMKVPKAPLLDCLTCTLCNKLFSEATTICECLHTFCMDCICQRFNLNEENHCPVCNVLLGCAPLEKLRVDSHLRTLTEKLFPFSSRKRSISCTDPAFALSKQKERTLSSLGVLAFSSSSNPNFATKRSKPTVGKGHNTSTKEEVDLRSLKNYVVIRKAVAADGLSPQHVTMDVLSEAPHTSDTEKFGTTASNTKKFWKVIKGEEKSFNFLSARPGHKHKAGCSHEETDMPFVAADSPSLAYLSDVAGADVEGYKPLSNVPDATNEAAESPDRSPMFSHSLSLRVIKNFQRVNSHRKKLSSSVYLPKDMKDRPSRTNVKAVQARSSKSFATLSDKKNGVWFALRAAENQVSEGALPQISAAYIRIRDERLPVSLVKKFLARKLDLKSETEVEITCRGQPIVSSLPLESVQKIWLATAASATTSSPEHLGPREDCDASCTAVETANAQGLLMVLTYGRNRRLCAISH